MGDLSTTHAARTRRAGAAVAIATGLVALAPVPANAATQTFGSDLAASADVAQAHQRDVAYWQTSFADGRLPTVPVQGQIKEIRLKGFALSDRGPTPSEGGGERYFHFQALTPQTGGTVRARITSQAFAVPGRNEANASTITTFRPENFCVNPGEYVAFNSIGGWDGVANRDPLVGPVGPYPDGTPMQVFASRPGALTTFFSADQGTNNGASFLPRGPEHPADVGGTMPGTELLMQMTLAIGDDRSYECGGPNTYRPADPVPAPKPGGGGAPPGVQKASIPKQRINVSKKGVAGMALFCQPGPTTCTGTVTIATTVGKRTLVVASKAYAIKAKSTGKLQLKLTSAGFKRFKALKRALPATVAAVTAPGGRDYTSTYAVTMRKIGAR